MGPRGNVPVSADDLNEYLAKYSDFGFEIQVLNELTRLGFTCEHGGTYDDPVTKKPRQFDIRAWKQFDMRFVRLAVECKNIQPDFPLLVSCLPRRAVEAFHEVVLSVDPAVARLDGVSDDFYGGPRKTSMSLKVEGEQAYYREADRVGKACAQVRRANSGITATDADVFEKWSQAVSSADDLVSLAAGDGERIQNAALTLVVLAVVVPDGQLWVAEFDELGNNVVSPARVNRCAYFIGRTYSLGFMGDVLTVSHLEFVTVSGLSELLNGIAGSPEALQRVMPLPHEDTAE